MGNALNDYFTEHMEHTVNLNLQINKLNYLQKVNSVFEFNYVYEYEVEMAIKRLKNKKCESDDGLSNYIAKKISQELIIPLAYFYNEMILSRIFPESLKCIKVVPLPKDKDKPTLISNYRALSIVSPLSKIFENLMSKQIKKYLHENKLLYEHQYGFTHGKNTDMAVRYCYESLLLNKKNVSVIVAIDLRKAFDTVRLDVIEVKLKRIGFTECAIELLMSYLTGRTQYVAVKKKGRIYKSILKLIKSGVPQGSI